MMDLISLARARRATHEAAIDELVAGMQDHKREIDALNLFLRMAAELVAEANQDAPAAPQDAEVAPSGVTGQEDAVALLPGANLENPLETTATAYSADTEARPHKPELRGNSVGGTGRPNEQVGWESPTAAIPLTESSATPLPPEAADPSTAARKDEPGKATVRDALAQIGDDPVKAAQPPVSEGTAFASTGDSILTRVPEVSSPAGTQAPPVDARPADKPKGIKERVWEVNQAHPEWSAAEIARHLSVTPSAVSLAVKMLSLTLPEGARGPKPKPQEREPREPEEQGSGEAGETTFAPRVRRVSGTRFRLRERVGEGRYLHMTGEGLVDDKRYAWIGGESQLLAIRQKRPEARELREEIVRDER